MGLTTSRAYSGSADDVGEGWQAELRKSGPRSSRIHHEPTLAEQTLFRE